ncbi:hypothetical protein BDU57DRAFT_514977 [Ampelomyces quisqualis]|uniref:Uncharacterized protein n=1 Tax=Ampelomyces quisqualis TaxID=50730 RepID=A0A6A5QUQ9_AMPQU|nr:hypothetical protein BDU57DRAFT_514977 [Ampelomyces quisqualis]
MSSNTHDLPRNQSSCSANHNAAQKQLELNIVTQAAKDAAAAAGKLIAREKRKQDYEKAEKALIARYQADRDIQATKRDSWLKYMVAAELKAHRQLHDQLNADSALLGFGTTPYCSPTAAEIDAWKERWDAERQGRDAEMVWDYEEQKFAWRKFPPVKYW